MDYGQDVFLSQTDRWLPGVKSVIAVPSPTAGNEWSIIVPGGQQWRVVAGQASISTSVAVANRLLGLQVVAGPASIWAANSALALPANTSGDAIYEQDYAANGPVGLGNNAIVNIPTFWLVTGMVLSSFTIGLQAADQYSGVLLYVEQLHVTDSEVSRRREQFERVVG